LKATGSPSIVAGSRLNSSGRSLAFENTDRNDFIDVILVLQGTVDDDTSTSLVISGQVQTPAFRQQTSASTEAHRVRRSFRDFFGRTRPAG
jgi:hypothetical protein